MSLVWSSGVRRALVMRPAFQRITRHTVASRVAHRSTISDAITKDHRELEQYYKEVVNSADPDHQQRYGNQFTWELARHAVGEELVVYPAFEKHLGAEGKEMAEHDRAEHRKVKEMLKAFQKMSSTDPAYVPQIKELWAVLETHIREEEERDLPKLEAALDPSRAGHNPAFSDPAARDPVARDLAERDPADKDPADRDIVARDLADGDPADRDSSARDPAARDVSSDAYLFDDSESLAASFGRTKAFAPSRSHPAAGEHPPFETVMGLLTAPIDRIADLFRKFPDRTVKPDRKVESDRYTK